MSHNQESSSFEVSVIMTIIVPVWLIISRLVIGHHLLSDTTYTWEEDDAKWLNKSLLTLTTTPSNYFVVWSYSKTISQRNFKDKSVTSRSCIINSSKIFLIATIIKGHPRLNSFVNKYFIGQDLRATLLVWTDT